MPAFAGMTSSFLIRGLVLSALQREKAPHCCEAFSMCR